MQEWEYIWCLVRRSAAQQERGGKPVMVRTWEGSDAVDELGKQGWELVSVQPFETAFTGESWAGGPGGAVVGSYMLFFKREKATETLKQDPESGSGSTGR